MRLKCHHDLIRADLVHHIPVEPAPRPKLSGLGTMPFESAREQLGRCCADRQVGCYDGSIHAWPSRLFMPDGGSHLRWTHFQGVCCMLLPTSMCNMSTRWVSWQWLTKLVCKQDLKMPGLTNSSLLALFPVGLRSGLQVSGSPACWSPNAWQASFFFRGVEPNESKLAWGREVFTGGEVRRESLQSSQV